MIRQATQADIPAIAAIDRTSFSGSGTEQTSEQWITANFNQSDKYRYFVAQDDQAIQGYIGWEIKGGFRRKTPVVELQRLAVAESARGKGIGSSLPMETLEHIRTWIKQVHPQATTLRIFVWTKKSNEGAIKIYSKICPDVKGERNIYDADEIMLSGEYPL